jgi:hypothetical protein
VEEVVAMSDRPETKLEAVLADEGGAILGEVVERLDADLSEKDLVAVATAITKALVVAANRGVAEATAQIAEQHPDLELKLHHDVTQYDEWAERYGDEP